MKEHRGGDGFQISSLCLLNLFCVAPDSFEMRDVMSPVTIQAERREKLSRRVILETSTLASAVLRIGSIPLQVLLEAFATCVDVLVSSDQDLLVMHPWRDNDCDACGVSLTF